jgi:hypothetical protein
VTAESSGGNDLFFQYAERGILNAHGVFGPLLPGNLKEARKSVVPMADRANGRGGRRHLSHQANRAQKRC